MITLSLPRLLAYIVLGGLGGDASSSWLVHGEPGAGYVAVAALAALALLLIGDVRRAG